MVTGRTRQCNYSVQTAGFCLAVSSTNDNNHHHNHNKKNKNTTKMKSSVLKNVVQIFVFVVILTTVYSTRIPAKAGISKIQEIPQYRFHYYVQNDKIINHHPYEEYTHGEKVQVPYSVADPKGDIEIVSYRAEKSNRSLTDVNTQASASPFQISLNNPVYNTQNEPTKDSTVPSEVSPIVVQPMNMQEQKSSKSIQMESKNEYHLVESTDKSTPLTEQRSSNETEDRKDDVKDEQATDQILIQDEGTTSKQIEFTVPFIKPNPVNANDFKYNDNDDIKKDIVKVIQNINGEYEQNDPQLLHLKNILSNKPLKIFGLDSGETDQHESYQQNHDGNLNFKSQQVSNKPLKLFGYNPSTFSSLYDVQTDYNRPSQIQQPPNPFNQGYFVGYGNHEDNVKQQTYDNAGIYLPQPNLMYQNGNYKGNQKYNVPIPTQQPLYYYDPNSMVMLPIYTNMIQNAYPFSIENKHHPAYPLVEIKPQPAHPFIENKPQPAYSTVENKPLPVHPFVENKPQPTQPNVENKPQPVSDSNKSNFNIMQVLSGGSFYKSSEQQAVSSQQSAVKETNKFEKSNSELYDKSKPQQTLMFYLNPGETPIDLKSLTSGPVQFTLGQQPQTDCDGKKLMPQVKPEKPLQPIPLCSDCVPALGLMGLPSTKSTANQKKSIGAPQVMPLWNGPNFSKLNYLILPTPITK